MAWISYINWSSRHLSSLERRPWWMDFKGKNPGIKGSMKIELIKFTNLTSTNINTLLWHHALLFHGNLQKLNFKLQYKVNILQELTLDNFSEIGYPEFFHILLFFRFFLKWFWQNMYDKLKFCVSLHKNRSTQTYQ